MNRIINIKYLLISLSIAWGAAYIFTSLTNMSFLASFLIVAMSLLLNGLVSDYEDNLPGGFSEPLTKDELIIIERAKRKKKAMPVRIVIWGTFILILVWFIWLYATKSV